MALPRAYWAVVAAVTVLRPGFGQTFTRGAERVLGTLLGVVIATLVAVALNPSGWSVVAVVAVLACAHLRGLSSELHRGRRAAHRGRRVPAARVAPGTVQTALDRGIDTAIGGAIGLIAYALWPTWSAVSAGPLMSTLVDAQHAYLDAVLTGLTTGRRLPETQLRTLARQARIAFTDADTALGLARSEPRRGGPDPHVDGHHAQRAAPRGPRRARSAPGHGDDACRPAIARAGAAAGRPRRRAVVAGGDVRGMPGMARFPPLRELYRTLAREHAGAARLRRCGLRWTSWSTPPTRPP